jgi:hypothetical protein
VITPDGTRMPWVCVRGLRWHRRVPEDSWQDRVLLRICTTACGQRVDPLYVATVAPTPHPDVCAQCAQAEETECTS